MNTIEKVKQWFIDRDLENGGRLDKQSLKLSEEFGELCAGYLKKNEKVTKDSIGDCAVVIVGLALLIKEDVNQIFEESGFIENEDVMEYFKWLSTNISEFQLYQNQNGENFCRYNLVKSICYLKSISNALGYDFEECFELAYQEIKDRKGRWIDGYIVEKEKKYEIKLLNQNDGDLYLVNQNANLADKYGHFSPVVLLFTKSTFFSEKCYKLTKKEVVSNGFGWVFDCPGVEVQEVE